MGFAVNRGPEDSPRQEQPRCQLVIRHPLPWRTAADPASGRGLFLGLGGTSADLPREAQPAGPHSPPESRKLLSLPHLESHLPSWGRGWGAGESVTVGPPASVGIRGERGRVTDPVQTLLWPGKGWGGPGATGSRLSGPCLAHSGAPSPGQASLGLTDHQGLQVRVPHLPGCSFP